MEYNFEEDIEPIKGSEVYDFESDAPIVFKKTLRGEEPQALDAVGKTVGGMFTGVLPKGLGALQKPLDVATDYWGDKGMTPEEEKELQVKHPNLMAARYAGASLLLPGVSEKFASPEDMESFIDQAPEEQRLQILGLSASYMAFWRCFKGGRQRLDSIS